jgi:hypothetical protein
MTNLLNELMDKRAEEYTNEDVDAIVAHVRKQLAMYDAGLKPKRESEENIDWTKLVAGIAKQPVSEAAPVKKMRRRV